MISRSASASIAAALALAAAGCASQPRPLYSWGEYESLFYRHYRNPQDHEAWVRGLKTTIVQIEQRGRKIPPGLYAEYGYALFEEGNLPQAIGYFEREKAAWPESAVLMEKMIRNAQRRAAPAQSPALQPAAAHGPAGALEKTP